MCPNLRKPDSEREPLPVDAMVGEVLASFDQHPNLILQAPTGAGKTTRVPPALVDLGPGQVILVEPRRLAVRAAARRMAQEWGSALGQEVGYAVRMDAKHSKDTRLLTVTPGILLRRMLQDPFLEGIDTIVFDEFHERGLDADLSLCVARQVQKDVRPDLRIVLMSATLDTHGLCKWLGDAPSLLSEGRSFPVDIEYQSVAREVRLENAISDAVLQMHEKVAGNLLIFLPGVGEIRRCEAVLRDKAQRRKVELMTLYGEMDGSEQDRVLRAGDQRRWILSTNVAESSVTVHGVEAVIDSGLQRRMEMDPQVGLDQLVLTRISQASADQRAGRAGRTAPGRCLRLWPAHEQGSLLPHDPPEISRVDPAGAMLWLLAFGEKDPLAFAWLDKPHPAAAEGALELLRRLGAWKSDRGLTEWGKRMANMPLHPRLARLLLAGQEFGVPDRAALAAILCSERWPFDRAHEAAQHHSDSDLLDAVEALEGFRDNGTLHAGVRPLRRGPAAQLLRLAKRLEGMLGKEPGKSRQKVDRDEALMRAVAWAFRDRLAKRRGGDGSRALMAAGRGVRIGEQSAVADAELFVCVQIVQGRGEAQARVLSSVEAEWYGPDALGTEERIRFDSDRYRLVAHRVHTLDDLPLSEKPVPISDWDAALTCLVEAASKDLTRALPLQDKSVLSFLERVRFLAEHMPELEWPTFSDAELIELLPTLALGCKSFEDLQKAPLLDHLRGRLTQPQRQTLGREAPSHFRLPKGREVRLQYEGGKPPVLASRIQDFFGMEQTPRVAKGRVSVLLHLLAPNRRPQQVTDDLVSFWDNTYGLVRKELKRRYPKHDWPEDPRS